MKLLQEIKITEEGSKNCWIKLIISVLFLLISLNIFLLNLNPLSGYVYSFYQHVPILFWIFSIIIFLVSSILLIELNSLQSKYVYILFFIILFNNSIILFSPYICGAYVMSGGDLLSHGGMVLDIFQNGKINFDVNFYPLTHILVFSISSISNIDYMDSVKSLSPIFSLLFPLYFYILAKEITENRLVQNLTFLISSTFYFSSLFNPHSITATMGASILLLPLLFFLFIKNMNTSKNVFSFTICLILSFSSYVFFHPVTSIILTLFFLLLFLLKKIMKIQFIHRGSLFFSIMFSAYIFYLTKVWIRPIKNINNFLLGYKIILGKTADFQTRLGNLGLIGFDLAFFFVKAFGHQILLLLLSFFSFIFIIFRYRGEKYKNIFFTIFVFMLTSGILVSITLIKSEVLNISVFRFIPYFIFFTPILSSLYLSKFRKRIFVIIILSFLFINSLLIVYPSPYINMTNSQVTHRDLSGSRWILDHKKLGVGLSGYFGRAITSRLISGLIPYSQFFYDRYTVWYDEKSNMPDHLGYEENSNIWDTLQEERYLIISKRDIVAYTQVYRHVARISLEDIQKVKIDYTALFVYENGEYVVFYISR